MQPAVQVASPEHHPHASVLMSWDMSEVRKRLVHHERITEEHAFELEREYKRFLLVTMTGNRGSRFPISSTVDVFWHAHLLFTRDYVAMCQATKGSFIHHEPVTSKQDAEAVRRAYFENTLPGYERLFGVADERFWPRANFIHCSFSCSD